MEAALEYDQQIGPSLVMDNDRDHRQLQLQHAASGQHDLMHVHDGERGDSRHFGRLLDAINIGSNDIPPSTALIAHDEHWPQSDRLSQKQVTCPLFVALYIHLTHFVCHRDLKNGSERSRTQESLELSTS
jgi:hypothetical protein